MADVLKWLSPRQIDYCETMQLLNSDEFKFLIDKPELRPGMLVTVKETFHGQRLTSIVTLKYRQPDRPEFLPAQIWHVHSNTGQEFYAQVFPEDILKK